MLPYETRQSSGNAIEGMSVKIACYIAATKFPRMYLTKLHGAKKKTILLLYCYEQKTA
jgi:hypothetical protein